MATQKVFTSGPSAVRGKAPVTTKTVPVKAPAVPPSRTSSTSTSKPPVNTSLAKQEAAMASREGNQTKPKTDTKKGVKDTTPKGGKKDSGLKFYPGTFTPIGQVLDDKTKEVVEDESVTTTTNRIPQYDSTGKLLGYLVQIIDSEGKIVSSTFESANAPVVEEEEEDKRSAYDLLTLELTNMGLSSLIKPLKNLFERGVTDSDTLRLELSQTPEYQLRFSANESRLKKGLRALTPAEYIKLEDQYQEVMRNYGLPASYYTKDTTGKQAGFDTLLGNDVSAVELEDRITVAQNRVLNANPEVLSSLKSFYGDTITNGDILAYTLNPEKGLEDIKRKVTAAEISGAAQAAGLNKIAADTTAESIAGMRTRAEELAAAGVTKEAAQQQYGTIAELANRGGMLADIYKTGPYGQAQAESEIFNVSGQTEAARQRKKLTSLETAAFSGQSGVGALGRERAGNI
jgi:hypothetical protein